MSSAVASFLRTKACLVYQVATIPSLSAATHVGLRIAVTQISAIRSAAQSAAIPDVVPNVAPLIVAPNAVLQFEARAVTRVVPILAQALVLHVAFQFEAHDAVQLSVAIRSRSRVSPPAPLAHDRDDSRAAAR